MKRFLSVLTAAAITLGTTAAYAADGTDNITAPAYDTATLSAVINGDETFDNSAAERLYIENLFKYGNTYPSFNANHGSELLTGSEKSIYEKLLPIVKDIADGKRTDTSGLDVSGEHFDSEEALGAAIHKVIGYLKADHPELFYWFGNLWECSFNLDTNYLALNLRVSSDYSDSGNVYKVNSSKMDRARQAVNNAKAIVDEYSGKPAHEKIYGYAETICSLTDYATDAPGKKPYGDPWQMVDVFDNVDSTKVVCEGYAKAFQYLCDLSGIDCYSVTGSDHMWNIVVLDGKSYHVDCTWADSFSIDVVISYHPYILRGVAKSDGTGVEFNFEVPGYYPTTGSLTYDDDTLSMYPQSILKVSTDDYVPKQEEINTKEINVKIKLPNSDAPDTSGLSVQILVGDKEETITITDGKLDISHLDDNDYKMTFSAKNCAPRTYTITIKDSAANLGSVELNLYGDINGDGKLTLGDVLKANAAARNSKPLTGYDKSIADINGDGKISLGDVLKMNAHARNSKLLW